MISGVPQDWHESDNENPKESFDTERGPQQQKTATEKKNKTTGNKVIALAVKYLGVVEF